MAPRRPAKPATASIASGNCKISTVIDPNARVTKVHKPKKRRDGLLNTKIPVRSDLMKIAKGNSETSPLLRLPGEIRNMIWVYALGGHRINVLENDNVVSHTSRLIDAPNDSAASSPTFQLPQVCRQLYAETALLPYQLNTFALKNTISKSGWVKSLCAAQRRSITSLRPNYVYWTEYSWYIRKPMTAIFTNLKSVDVTEYVRYPWVRIEDEYGRRIASIVESIRAREGSALEVTCEPYDQLMKAKRS
ncbi:hypothetical protein BDV96DRAFT_597106 [Lophiotrema nucula]|uniref:DUF7730 domain-containing protein n=1 Tax=Lophiotrema nucula TaxID=690887 RepID=A0A6A5ZIK1_9PLEO|nr:hypothetical protein BDV96DRAFT_597106 [Lophiotrema nucula]